MISILIPVYNYDVSTLVHQLTKQAGQIENYEILVMDDCSTLPRIELMYKEINSLPNTTVFFSERNYGRAKTRERIAEKANYNQLLFLDADTTLAPESHISKFIDALHKNIDVIFGGISYGVPPVDKSYLLRWKYGKQKEEKSLQQRLKKPYEAFMTGAFIIKKEKFVSLSKFFNEDSYGMDILLAYQLQQNRVKIKHIENPVIHLGLDSNEDFLQKSLEAIQTSFDAEMANLLPNNFRPVQRTYLKLKRTGMLVAFMMIMKRLKYRFEKAVIKEASVLKLDLLKLYHYAQLKQNE